MVIQKNIYIKESFALYGAICNRNYEKIIEILSRTSDEIFAGTKLNSIELSTRIFDTFTMNHNLGSGIDNAAQKSQTLQAEEQVTIVTKTSVLPDMTKAEAHHCINQIKQHATSMRQLLVDLEERRGWKELNYSSMSDCLKKEFNQSNTSLKYELSAGRIEKDMGVPIGTYMESHLRPLRKLNSSLHQSALDTASEVAGKHPVRAKHVGQAVKDIVLRQSESANIRVEQMEDQSQDFGSEYSSQKEFFMLRSLVGEDIQYNGSWATALEFKNISTVRCQVLNHELEIKQENIKQLDMDEQQFTRQKEIIERVQRLAGCNLDPVAWTILETLNRQVEYSDYQLRMLEMTEQFYKIHNYTN